MSFSVSANGGSYQKGGILTTKLNLKNEIMSTDKTSLKPQNPAFLVAAVSSSTLSRAKAQIAFVEEKKISHKYFLEGEFVRLNSDKKMEDENGVILNKTDFWLTRGAQQFDDGWFVVE